MFNLDFEKIFQSIFNSLSGRIGEIGSIVAGIVGIGALFYFAGKTWGALSRNEPIDIYPLLKPLVIVFLCLNFNAVVIAPTHYILSPLRTYTIKLVSAAQQENKNFVDQVVDKAKEDRKREQQARNRSWWEKITDSFGNVMFNIGVFLLKILLEILSFAKQAIYVIMNFLRLFFLIILGMAGPIAFTLSLFPSFENSLSNWFAKYISIYLWAPICNIISIILCQAESTMVNLLLTGGSEMSFITVAVMLVIFYVIGFYSYLSIPTIATWVVQGGASSLELASTLQGARKAALLAGGVAAAGSGKVAGSVKNMINKIKK
jgi:conjugative transposon TraJ protein